MSIFVPMKELFRTTKIVKKIIIYKPTKRNTEKTTNKNKIGSFVRSFMNKTLE